LTEYHLLLYGKIKENINKRLSEFSNVPKDKYFYEFCYCICTPQSKARSAFEVQRILEERDFYNNPFDPTEILRFPGRYIRFHNVKSKRLLDAIKFYPLLMDVLNSDESNFSKRDWIAHNFNGFSFKESSHFLRNIGYRGLAILDRHILRHLAECGVYSEIPAISSEKQYKKVEEDFLRFSEYTKIPVDELDLLFWASSTGEILK